MNLIYNRHAYITARKLARALRIKAKREDKNKGMPVIRYGSSRYFGYENLQVNSPAAIRFSANKFLSFMALSENKITIPKFYLANKIDEIEYPVLARKSHHKQGRDIILCGNREEASNALLSNRDYFVEFVEARAEYRVHCIDNQVVKIFRKVERHSVTNDFIRCARFGWGFYKIDSEQDWLEPMKNKALKSLEVLGLYFGAVDVIHSIDRKFVVLEVNSAPALNTETLILYADKLRRWLEENYEMERIYRTTRNQRRT